MFMLAFLPAILAGAAYLAIALRPGRSAWPAAWRCRGCGYDCSGLGPGMPCPECGADPSNPATRTRDATRNAQAFAAVLSLLPVPLILPPLFRAASSLLDSATGFNLHRALAGTHILEFGWLFGYGALVLVHCLAIELCVRRILRRRRTPAVILACAIPVWLLSTILCGYASVMLLLRFMPD